MKQKIRIHDNIHGKVVEKEVVMRNTDHFAVQLKNRANIFKDKTKYTRKIKHKKREF